MHTYLTILIMTITCVSGLKLSENRQLFIFGKETHESLVRQQLSLFDSFQRDIKDRDLTIVTVSGNVEVYKEYKVKSNEYAVILIGKDGSEKMRWNKIALPKEIFSIIDAMPMRKREM